MEGRTEDPDIIALRERQKCNLMATLLLSQGTPMILAGDEIGHRQQGMNNAYAQDNEITWLDWGKLRDEDRGLLEFTRKLIAVRKAYPILHRGRFLVLKRRGSDATILILFNAHHDVVEFTLPEAPEGARWVGLIDTNDPARTEPPSFNFGHVYEVTGRSLLLFVLATQENLPRTWPAVPRPGFRRGNKLLDRGRGAALLAKPSLPPSGVRR